MLSPENTKTMIRLPDGDRAFFDIVIGVLQGDTLTINSIYNQLKWCRERESIDLMKVDCLKLKKGKEQTVSRRKQLRSWDGGK